MILLFSLNPKLTSQQSSTYQSYFITYAQGRIVIQFKEEVSPIITWKVDEIVQTGISSIDNLCKTFKVHAMRRQFPALKFPSPDLTRHFIVMFDESKNLDAAVNAFSRNPFIEKVEKVGTHDVLAVPNDPEWHLQWYLYEWTVGSVDIDAIEAWDIQTGNSSVILAFPDTGIRYLHPDLHDNFWINTLEDIDGDGKFTISDLNHVDDDGNGYVDDVIGYDFYQNDCNPQDSDGHGTHCAGISAAETNNGEGVAGIAGGWYPGQEGCSIMALRAGKYVISMDYAASAIVYATNKEATAINCSWKSSNTGGLGDAVDYAIQNGVLVIAAAGNDGENRCNDIDNYYLSTRSDVMVIAATDRKDKRAIFEEGASNYGDCVDISAPGKNIYSTCQSASGYCDWEDYNYKSGTSMAAPMVVGVAGLLKSQRPDWGREEIWDAIVLSADPLEEAGMGSGRLNAYEAIKQTWVPNAPSNLNAYPTAYNQINLSWQDNSDNENGFKIQRRTNSTGFSTIETVGENVTSYQDKTCTIGVTYYYRIIAHNVSGNSSPSNTKSATIPATAPAAPSNLRGICGAFEVQLTWHDNANNEQYFVIERKTDWDPWWEEIDLAGPNMTLYYDEDPPYADTIYYRIKAYNQYGYSPYSNTASVRCFWGALGLNITADKTIVDSGESVTYTYSVENKGQVDLFHVELIDDKFGTIATEFDLRRGETKSFIKTVTLTKTTTNLAEATAIYYHKEKAVTVKANAQTTVEVKK